MNVKFNSGYPKLHSPKVWFATQCVARSNKLRGFYTTQKPAPCRITVYKDGKPV